MHEIIVPLDRSPLGERAVSIARRVADHTSAPIRLVEVAAELEADGAGSYLRSVADSLLSGCDAEVQVIQAGVGESVAERLLGTVGDHEPQDTLIVMSTHGRSGIGAAVMGSTAEDMLRRAHQPILMVGHRCELPWPDQRRSLLVPIDGSERYRELMAPVVEVYGRSGLQPVLIKITHSLDAEEAEHPMSGLDDAGQQLADRGVDAKMVHRFASNVPYALTEAAREWGAALIVMATYVKPGASRALLGSVTMRTIHDAPCPVLVYPGLTEGSRS